MPPRKEPDPQVHGVFDWHRRAGPIFKYGLAVGLLLVILGGASMALQLTNQQLEYLVVCSGIAIILGAFGSTASLSVPTQSVTLLGVAGIALYLFSMISHSGDVGYLRIKVSGDVDGARIMLVGDESYLGAYQTDRRHYDFIIVGTRLQRSVLELIISWPESDVEVPFDCISSDTVRPHLASGRTLEWRFDKARSTLKEAGSSVVVARLGNCDGADSPAEGNSEPAFAMIPSLMSSAIAQEPETQSDIDALLADLESPVDYVRYDARKKLGAAGVDALDPLLANIAKEDASYRAKLGALVAIVDMLRSRRVARELLISKTDSAHIASLVDAAASQDAATRVHASEILYHMADPRAVVPALERAESASPNGAFNLVLVTKSALPYLNEAEKGAVTGELSALKSSSGPRTTALIDSVIASNRSTQLRPEN